MSFAHKRTPPGQGAALKSIRDEADERAEYTLASLGAQPVPRIIALHWIRPGEALPLEATNGE
jgi:hypothetical protein